ncbi:unnamed protein product [Blepharisma stoltei]|uniref:CRAL-TRIO domain-containing protein n=1 Tax=Blepharisma stoltei TaxID=1481888 RepID=A0AAU9JU42_9CILI|nr:unnamed protein product [Blepharisma stoltei]
MKGQNEQIIPDVVRPPPSSYFFKPGKDIATSGKGKKIQRFVFKGQDLTELEIRKLARLEEEVKKQGIIIPGDWDRTDMLRFYYGTGWKTRKALKGLLNHLKWKQQIFPRGYLALYPEVAELLNTGAFYMHGRDHYYRPILIMNCAKFQFKKVPDDVYIRFLCFFFEYVTQNVLLPEHVENWVNLADMAHLGMTKLPISSLSKLSKILQPNFRCRLGVNYIVNPPSTAVFMWGLVKPFLDEGTIQKVNLLNDSIPRPLLTHCNPNQIEQKYGGTAPNLTQFWPPTFPSGPISPFDVNIQTIDEKNTKNSREMKKKQKIKTPHSENLDLEEVVYDNRNKSKDKAENENENEEEKEWEVEKLIENDSKEEEKVLIEEQFVENKEQKILQKKKKRKHYKETKRVSDNEIDVDNEAIIQNKRDKLSNLVFEEYKEMQKTEYIAMIVETKTAEPYCGIWSIPDCSYSFKLENCQLF